MLRWQKVLYTEIAEVFQNLVGPRNNLPNEQFALGPFTNLLSEMQIYTTKISNGLKQNVAQRHRQQANKQIAVAQRTVVHPLSNSPNCCKRELLENRRMKSSFFLHRRNHSGTQRSERLTARQSGGKQNKIGKVLFQAFANGIKVVHRALKQFDFGFIAEAQE